MASLLGTPSFSLVWPGNRSSPNGAAGAVAGLPSDAIASHAEPAEVKADPREEVDVGQGGKP